MWNIFKTKERKKLIRNYDEVKIIRNYVKKRMGCREAYSNYGFRILKLDKGSSCMVIFSYIEYLEKELRIKN